MRVDIDDSNPHHETCGFVYIDDCCEFIQYCILTDAAFK